MKDFIQRHSELMGELDAARALSQGYAQQAASLAGEDNATASVLVQLSSVQASLAESYVRELAVVMGAYEQG